MKLTEGGKLAPPNVCTICERTPPPGEPVVDTEKYFDGYPHTLRGKRYICRRCVTEAAKLVDGRIPKAEFEFVEHERDEARLELKYLKELIADLGGRIGSSR